MQRKHFNSAFSLIELMIMLVVIGISIQGIIWYTTSNNKNKQAYYLAEHSAVYANLFAHYIATNQSTIENSLESTNGSVIISYATLANNGYITPGLNGNDALGIIPCVSVKKSSYSNKLTPLLFYVNSHSNNANLNFDIIKRATVALGGVAGYIDNNNTIISRGGWNLDPYAAGYLGNLATCNGISIMQNSLVINLTMLPAFNQALYDDLSLNRMPVVGLNQHNNALRTDLILTHSNNNVDIHHGIFFTNDHNLLSNPAITSGNNSQLSSTQSSTNNVVITANFLADSVRPLAKISAWTVCNSTDLYKTVVEDTSADAYANLQYTSVSCDYSPLQCRLHTNNLSDYCYIPTKQNTIRMVNNSVGGSGWMGYTYTCPPAVPIAIDGAYNPIRLYINWVACQNKNNCDNQSQIYNGDLGSGQFILNSITLAGNNYNIATGYQALPGINTSDCNALCQVLNFSGGSSDTSPYLCQCTNGSDQSNSVKGRIIAVGTSGLGNIQYVTCTNRAIVQ